jgi:hypothetical protein
MFGKKKTGAEKAAERTAKALQAQREQRVDTALRNAIAELNDPEGRGHRFQIKMIRTSGDRLSRYGSCACGCDVRIGIDPENDRLEIRGSAYAVDCTFGK